jgi:hypothetical protein
MQKQPFQFVGGPYDGRQLLVPGPTETGLELRVYPVEPWEPGSSYLLGNDGRFRFANNDGELNRRVAREPREHLVGH